MATAYVIDNLQQQIVDLYSLLDDARYRIDRLEVYSDAMRAELAHLRRQQAAQEIAAAIEEPS